MGKKFETDLVERACLVELTFDVEMHNTNISYSIELFGLRHMNNLLLIDLLQKTSTSFFFKTRLFGIRSMEQYSTGCGEVIDSPPV